jgi:EAL domain-containing protein (putative c-di-GMP-specific phosphodiesterase class I)
MLRPAEFIPVAEHAGLINRLGAWVVEEACRQSRQWVDAGIAPDVVAINVSATQFKCTPELDDIVSASLQRHRIKPSTIELELTESVLMDVSQHAEAKLTRLREMGLRISIDDFGTGYSSLNYLTLFPFSRLKIAQELVLRVAEDARSAAVVRASIHLANELGIECIAEGVESARQLNFLINAGCGYGQGYYFTRPMNAERMTALLKDADGKFRARPRLAMAG